MTVELPARRKWWRPSRTVALFMVVAGIIATGLVAYEAIRVIVRSVNGPQISVPGDHQVHLEQGRWVVFERRAIGNPFPSILPEDVDVRTSSRTRLDVREVTGSQTVTRTGESFIGAVEFTVPADDDIAIDVRRARPGLAIVARPVSDTFRSVGLWALLGLATFAVFVLGVVLLFLPAPTDAGRVPALPPPAMVGGPQALNQPGWYPDPSGQPLFRWWNGWQWTDQVMKK